MQWVINTHCIFLISFYRTLIGMNYPEILLIWKVILISLLFFLLSLLHTNCLFYNTTLFREYLDMSVLFKSKNIKQPKMNPKQDYLPFKISRMSIISHLNTRSTTILRANNLLITFHYRDI